VAGKRVAGSEPGDAGGLPDDLRGAEWPDAGDRNERRRDVGLVRWVIWVV
jgi:hypothetical protein